jgi:hypothetical protein
MKFYKNQNSEVFAYAADGSQDAFIKEGLTEITKAEADALRFPLSNKRQRAKAALVAQLQLKRNSGCPYTFPSGIAGHVQIRNEVDQGNINSRVTRALVLKAGGDTTTLLGFRDQENRDHDFTPDQMIAMGIAVDNFLTPLLQAKWAHDAAIEAWDGVGEYDVTTGWSS